MVSTMLVDGRIKRTGWSVSITCTLIRSVWQWLLASLIVAVDLKWKVHG
jgi:hypothetical protein